MEPARLSESFFDDDDFVFTCGYELIGDGAFGIAIRKGTSLEDKRRLLAAYKASQLGCKSIDYVLKMYGSQWDLSSKQTETGRLVSEATDKTRNRVDAIIRKLPALREVPEYPAAVAAYVAIMRLQSSFKAACLLCEEGLSFEVFCISKLILEQIAWAYTVHGMTDESFFKVQPSKCVSHLKSLFPKVGVWYGSMNEHSHVDTKVIHSLARVENAHLTIVLRSPQQSLVSAFHVLRLADIYGACAEAIWRRHYTTYEFIKKKVPPGLKARRKSLIELEDFQKRARRCLLHPGSK